MRFSLGIGFVAGVSLLLASSAKAQNAPHLAVSPPSGLTADSLRALQNQVTQVVARSRRAIVTVVVRKPRPALEKDKQEETDPKPVDPKPADAPANAPAKGAPVAPDPALTDPTLFATAAGTGWVCRSDGLIVTNYHVVSEAASLHVIFNADGAEEDIFDAVGIPARVVGFDIAADIAVIQIARTGLPTLELGDSDTVAIGQWLVALGVPLTQIQTAALGVLSGRERDVGEVDGDPPTPFTYLQTDALLIPGDSGGPLLDLSGRVVGLNTEGVFPRPGLGNMGYALPSNTIRRLLPRLIAGKPAKHAALGFETAQLSPAAAREFGVSGGILISEPPGDDNANAAKLQQGDIILRANGKTFSRLDLNAFILTRAPGDKLRLDIARPDFAGKENLKPLTVSLVLTDSAKVAKVSNAKLPASPPPAAPATGLGLKVGDTKDLDAAHRKKWYLDGDEKGAVVMAVTPFSRADEALLAQGRRITRARLGGRWTEITSASDWKKLEARAAPGAHLLLQLREFNDDSEFRVLVLPAKTG